MYYTTYPCCGTEQRSGEGIVLHARRSRVRDSMRTVIFISLPNTLGCTAPGVYSASHRNEYQKQRNMSSVRYELGFYIPEEGILLNPFVSSNKGCETSSLLDLV
jgi:hypothetical protein